VFRYLPSQVDAMTLADYHMVKIAVDNRLEEIDTI
jgi:hypothetical protein